MAELTIQVEDKLLKRAEELIGGEDILKAMLSSLVEQFVLSVSTSGVPQSNSRVQSAADAVRARAHKKLGRE